MLVIAETNTRGMQEDITNFKTTMTKCFNKQLEVCLKGIQIAINLNKNIENVKNNEKKNRS